MAIQQNYTILKTSSGAQLIPNEEETVRITATMKDETGAVIPLSGIVTMTLEIWARDAVDEHVILAETNILNTGRGVVGATDGSLVLTLLPADNIIVDDTLDQEWHSALIRVTFGSTKALNYLIEYPVRNVAKII